jgi:hypothetical protein
VKEAPLSAAVLSGSATGAPPFFSGRRSPCPGFHCSATSSGGSLCLVGIPVRFVPVFQGLYERARPEIRAPLGDSVILVGIPVVFVPVFQGLYERVGPEIGAPLGDGAILVGDVQLGASHPEQRVGAVLAEERIQGGAAVDEILSGFLHDGPAS